MTSPPAKPSTEVRNRPLSIERLLATIFAEAQKADRLAAMACCLMMAVPVVMFAITLLGIVSSVSFRNAGFAIVWLPVIETLPLVIIGGGLLLLNRRFSKRRRRDFKMLEMDLIADGLLSRR